MYFQLHRFAQKKTQLLYLVISDVIIPRCNIGFDICILNTGIYNTDPVTMESPDLPLYGICRLMKFIQLWLSGEDEDDGRENDNKEGEESIPLKILFFNLMSIKRVGILLL